MIVLLAFLTGSNQAYNRSTFRVPMFEGAIASRWNMAGCSRIHS